MRKRMGKLNEKGLIWNDGKAGRAGGEEGTMRGGEGKRKNGRERPGVEN
jgi:hypothetical protein